MRPWLTFPLLGLSLSLVACHKDKERESTEQKLAATATPAASALSSAVPAVVVPPVPSIVVSAPIPEPRRTCPKDMVLVKNRSCVDRYESSLVDTVTGETLSPYYPVLPNYTEFIAARRREAVTLLSGDAGESPIVPMPELPAFQANGTTKPKAFSRSQVIPNGHLTMPVAKAACAAAGKRLCNLEEWRIACRGEADQKFPYGPDYKPKQCNVFREDHPGRILYGNFSVGMQDPRMGTLETEKGPLLRRTGQTNGCASRWGGDAIYDMVGNLDEWIDDADGSFVGGFFSRATKEGCDTIVTAHAGNYRDYSLGARCCSDAK